MAELAERLARIASSQLPNAALVGANDAISVADVREIMRLLADRDGWVRAANGNAAALRRWQSWASDLLDEYGRQPIGGQHGDESARLVIGTLVGLAPGVPRCERCGCFSTRHEADDEELRGCVDCECTQYEGGRDA